MKNIKIIILLIITSSMTIMHGQKGKNDSYIDAYNFTPEENVYLHYNSSLLFAGEYLYYKVYSINTTRNQLSNLSKIVYVELINKEKKQIFKQSIRLKNGLGQGDFFINTTIPSGNYKLIAYTQWMKNGGRNYFYKADLSIINPYRIQQKSMIDTSNSSNKYISENYNNTRTSNYLELTTNSENYEKRSKVILNIKNLKESAGNGDYSISVRKIDTIFPPLKPNAINYHKNYLENINSKNKKDSKIYYPELNGGTISGRVIDSNTKQPVKDQNISLTIPEENFIFKTAITDENGEFYISIKENYEKNSGTLQILGEDKEKFKLKISEPPSVDLSQLTFSNFRINPDLQKMIVERSIYNQIENSYYAIKPDTIVSLPNQKSFYKEYSSKKYTLEDYTRFPTIKEVFIEIVEEVWTAKNESGDRVFNVRNTKDNNKNHLPLIFIDGVLIQDHNHLLEIKANKVKSIEVLRGEAHFGSIIYQGIIIVETLDKDYKNLLQGTFLKEIDLKKPLPIKNYYHPVYLENNNKTNRIPDYRTQLLWKPNLKLNTKVKEVVFYTSDQPGVYEISLEGFTNFGKPITLQKVITVK